MIWKVKNLLQASTNSANDHYCRWKADKASHFPNFITVLPFLYSPPTSLLSIYCWFYSLWASKSGSVLSLTVKVFTKRIQLKQKTLQKLLVEFRLTSSVEVVSSGLFTQSMFFHTVLHLCSCNEPLEIIVAWHNLLLPVCDGVKEGGVLT